MQKELRLFEIDGRPGGNQDWFRDPMMKLGGCAAVCACDSCLYFALFRGAPELYPFDPGALCREDYVRFSRVMKPYLRPRRTGVNRTELYIDGFSRYLHDCGQNRITMRSLPGTAPEEAAWETVRRQIDAELPVPCLTLNHADPAFRDYVWHWFLLTGYRDAPAREVKAVTYGAERWLSFSGLWNTGFAERGGLVLYEIK